MKKVITISLISLSVFLLSLTAFAQTKTKPKAAAKPAETKAANAKTASAKPVDKKTTVAKPKAAAPEKNAAQNSKSAKNTAAKTQKVQVKTEKSAEKPKTEKAKTEKTSAAKSQTAKNQSANKDSVKNQPLKTDAAAKKQSVKNQPQTAKSAIPPNTKLAAKPVLKNTLKEAPRQNDKTAENKIPTVKTAKQPAEIAVAPLAEPNFDAGLVVGKTYYNNTFNFSVALPDEWEIANAEFAERLKKEGFNLKVEAPKAAKANAQTNLNAAASRIQILLTAYKASTETRKNAILRVSIEDLRAVPQIKDAVDYFDALRATYQNIKLPAGFKYSETQAEKLGSMQFGFLDVARGAGKKRMYAIVRGGFALMFTLTYQGEEDLAALKNVLAAGDFRRR